MAGITLASRREFVLRAAAVGGALGVGLHSSVGAQTRETREPAGAARASRPLSILILGGTGFTGPAQVEDALARGHRVTLFNRDRTRPGMFADRVEQLIGDLNGATSALDGKKFDVVIDNPTTFPAWVRNVARFIRGNTSHYIFVSTISVYADHGTPNADETAATLPMPAGVDPYTLERQHAGRHFGPLKARAEAEVQQYAARQEAR